MDADVASVPLEELDRLWDYDDPAASERRFAALLPRALTEQDGALLAGLLTQLARAQGLQRRFDVAARTLREAEHRLRPGDAHGRVRLLLERGRLANTSGAEDRGRASFLEAWELARAAGADALAVDAAHMLGLAESPDEAWTWNERAMALARTSPDPGARRWVASLANNMGWARHDAGDHEEALALFRLALEERERQDEPREARIARWCVARCLRSLGRVEEALAEQRSLAAELVTAGEVDGFVDEELGECLLALGHAEAARPCFARAYELLAADAPLAGADPDRLERLRALGGL